MPDKTSKAKIYPSAKASDLIEILAKDKNFTLPQNKMIEVSGVQYRIRSASCEEAMKICDIVGTKQYQDIKAALLTLKAKVETSNARGRPPAVAGTKREISINKTGTMVVPVKCLFPAMPKGYKYSGKGSVEFGKDTITIRLSNPG